MPVEQLIILRIANNGIEYGQELVCEICVEANPSQSLADMELMTRSPFTIDIFHPF